MFSQHDMKVVEIPTQLFFSECDGVNHSYVNTSEIWTFNRWQETGVQWDALVARWCTLSNNCLATKTQCICFGSHFLFSSGQKSIWNQPNTENLRNGKPPLYSLSLLQNPSLVGRALCCAWNIYILGIYLGSFCLSIKHSTTIGVTCLENQKQQWPNKSQKTTPTNNDWDKGSQRFGEWINEWI